ncbi:MAG: 4Fe-4S binding protein [Anaerohalosphaeraceae bacterium]|nr:4Fe-4S binding protein [Anaerohalosphaeraceae bacterium]
MARKARINTEKCKGCYYCLDICPRKAIKKAGKSNEKGYDCVEVVSQMCNGCGACYIVCPDCCIDIIDDQ